MFSYRRATDERKKIDKYLSIRVYSSVSRHQPAEYALIDLAKYLHFSYSHVFFLFFTQNYDEKILEGALQAPRLIERDSASLSNTSKYCNSFR